MGQLGLGAAGFGIAALMIDGGATRVIACDPQEASHARAQERGIELASMDEVMRAADVGQIYPEEAERAGAAFAADGRSVNNVLGYPGIFRGALQAGASRINVEMKLAAARAIAEEAQGDELVPNVLHQSVHDAVARAVREAAEQSGVARPALATAGL